MQIEMIIKNIDLINEEFECVTVFKKQLCVFDMVKGMVAFNTIEEYIDDIKHSGFGLNVYINSKDLQATIDYFGYNIFKFQ